MSINTNDMTFETFNAKRREIDGRIGGERRFLCHALFGIEMEIGPGRDE